MTIDHGYDCKCKTDELIQRELEKAGVDPVLASRLSKAAGLNGKKAEEFIKMVNGISLLSTQ